jgi:hypothetical protein
MDEAEYLLQQLAQIPHQDPPSVSWPKALPHLTRFAINPLRPHLAEVKWVSRMQTLARVAIRTSLSPLDQLKQFDVELGEICLEEGYEMPSEGCQYIAKIIRILQGFVTEEIHHVDFVDKVMHMISVNSKSRSRSYRQLTRGISLVQKLFLMTREETFQHEVIHTEERHGILYFVSNDTARDLSIGSFVFHDLPKNMFKDSQDRTSLLMYSGCQQFAMDMMTQIQDFVGSEC